MFEGEDGVGVSGGHFRQAKVLTVLPSILFLPKPDFLVKIHYLTF